MNESAQNRWAKACKACGHRFTWQGTILDEPACPECFRRHLRATGEILPKGGVTVENGPPAPDETAERAFELCDSILSGVEELPSRAADFGESVSEKTKSIRESIEARGKASDGQISALENMLAGVDRWLD